MTLLQLKIISKLTVVFLTISVFCSFVLSGGDLFALETVAQKDIAGKGVACPSEENQRVLISNNHNVVDFLITKPFEKEDFVIKPQYSKKTFLLLALTKSHLKKSFSIYIPYDPHFKKIAKDFIPAYLLYHTMRI